MPDHFVYVAIVEDLAQVSMQHHLGEDISFDLG